MRQFTVGALFAGIGGIDLGFERAGFKTIWQVEIDPYCQKVLAKNFPHAERYADVRECGAHNLSPVDVVVGGFPCQDISNAGKRIGINGERSGLWTEYARIVRELRPSFVFVENVAALLGRGISRVLGDLAEIGYDSEWEIISAADVGAPHLRERIWIVAYTGSGRFGEPQTRQVEQPRRTEAVRSGKVVADSSSPRLQITEQKGWYPPIFPCGKIGHTATRSGWWDAEPELGRVAHGVPRRVDRLRGLGNAVVPQIPERFARSIRRELEFAAPEHL